MKGTSLHHLDAEVEVVEMSATGGDVDGQCVFALMQKLHGFRREFARIGAEDAGDAIAVEIAFRTQILVSVLDHDSGGLEGFRQIGGELKPCKGVVERTGLEDAVMVADRIGWKPIKQCIRI